MTAKDAFTSHLPPHYPVPEHVGFADFIENISFSQVDSLLQCLFYFKDPYFTFILHIPHHSQCIQLYVYYI